MSLYFSENFYETNSGYDVYPDGVMVASFAYTGDPDTVFALSPQGQWEWNTSMNTYFPTIVSTKLAWTGLAGLGTKKLLFYARGDGTHYSYLYRSTWATPITNASAKSIWIAMLNSCYNNKEIITWKFTKLTSDSGGNTPVSLLNWTAASPAKCQAGNGTTLLYTGDSGFTTHLLMMKVTMDGTPSHKVTIDYYVDPDLSTAPASWTKATTISDYYWGIGSGVADIKIDSGRNGTTIDSRNYFDCIRIADTWYEAIGKSSDPTLVNTGNFFPFSHP